MKISDANSKIQMDAYLNQTQAARSQGKVQEEQATQAAGQTAKKDKVELSDGSRLLNKIEQASAAEQSERTDKIRQIKEQIEAGTYKVDASKIADSMLKDLIKDLG